MLIKLDVEKTLENAASISTPTYVAALRAVQACVPVTIDRLEETISLVKAEPHLRYGVNRHVVQSLGPVVVDAEAYSRQPNVGTAWVDAHKTLRDGLVECAETAEGYRTAYKLGTAAAALSAHRHGQSFTLILEAIAEQQLKAHFGLATRRSPIKDLSALIEMAAPKAVPYCALMHYMASIRR